jgi:Zn-dependent membrane protease YugP
MLPIVWPTGGHVLSAQCAQLAYTVQVYGLSVTVLRCMRMHAVLISVQILHDIVTLRYVRYR